SAETVEYFVNVGLTAERVARQYGVTREQQDDFAFASHAKARAAQLDGRLGAEIAAVPTAAGLVERDGCVRDTSREKLATLKPAFLEDGSVTAVSSSRMTDGASAVLVCSDAFLTRHNLEPLARIASFAVS